LKNNIKVFLGQEIEVCQVLEHPNIVHYIGAKQEKNSLYIYMEFMPGGSIAKMLKDYGPLEEKLIRKYAKEVALGLDYLHGKGIAHRDVKVNKQNSLEN
jgi:mitogen-activated protein kinase kinase kinase